MENQELQIIQSPELNEVVKSSKIDLNKAELYAVGYAPLMIEVNEQNQIIKGLDKLKPEDAAKAKRASLDLGKILSRAKDKKAADKELLLLETKHIDNLFNLVESTGRLGQADAKEIFEYAEKVEAERLESIAESRRFQLAEFGDINPFVDLKAMDDDTFGKFLENERLAFTARKEAAEKAEQERKAAEERAEQERLAKIEADRIEQERIKAENEKLRLENEAKEKELAAERKKQAEEKAESERLAKIESEKQAKVLADQKKASDLQAAEAKKIQHAKDAEIDKLRAEQEAEKQRKEKELADEKARIEAEEAEKKAREKAAMLAPDKDKINALFVSIKDFKFPELQTPEANAILNDVKEGFQIILQGIKDKAKTLK